MIEPRRIIRVHNNSDVFTHVKGNTLQIFQSQKIIVSSRWKSLIGWTLRLFHCFCPTTSPTSATSGSTNVTELSLQPSLIHCNFEIPRGFRILDWTAYPVQTSYDTDIPHDLGPPQA
jgi:hypothetical protein